MIDVFPGRTGQPAPRVAGSGTALWLSVAKAVCESFRPGFRCVACKAIGTITAWKIGANNSKLGPAVMPMEARAQKPNAEGRRMAFTVGREAERK